MSQSYCSIADCNVIMTNYHDSNVIIAALLETVSYFPLTFSLVDW